MSRPLRFSPARCRAALALTSAVLAAGCAHPWFLPLAAAAPDSTTDVAVTAEQLQVTFPVDTSTTWGWPAGPTSSSRMYQWMMMIDGMDGPGLLNWQVYPEDTTARRFRSLAALVRSGYAGLCRGGMVLQCDGPPLRASVRDGRIVLTLEDSAAVARLFGTRPPTVRVWRRTPWEAPDYGGDLVAVRYVDPQIPLPDSATLAEAAAGWRGYQAGITTIYREVAAPRWRRYTNLWITVGDSMRLDVEESVCHHDSCGVYLGRVATTGWTSSDTTLVALEPCHISSLPDPPVEPSCIIAHGRRPGYATITASGLYGPSDTAASRAPPPREVSRIVRVGPPVASIAFVQAPDTAVVGDTVALIVEAFDAAGTPVDDVPILLGYDSGAYRNFQDITEPVAVVFDSAGRRMATAEFMNLADTVVVTVVEPRAD